MEKTEKRTTAKPTTRTEPFTASEAAGENVLRAFAGQVRDVDGVWFDVYEARVTMHGFDLLFGAPDASHALCEPNRQHLIVTPELRDFWLNNRAQGRGFLYDLPAGKTTIGNARRRLGLNWFADQRTFWTERIEDLRSLRIREFAAKHAVDPRQVIFRRKMFGVAKRKRAAGWWRRPEVFDVLFSGRKLKEMGLALGISDDQAQKLRVRAKKEYPDYKVTQYGAQTARPGARRSVSLLKGNKFPVCGQVRDVDGALWDVRDVRPTKHGFDLCFGNPDGARGYDAGGLPRLIVTKALREFWWENRTKSHGFLFDLPAGRTTLKRARSRLRFNQKDAVRAFYEERLDDLATLPIREFAAKHEVNPDSAFNWRFLLLGKSARPLGWWRTPETVKILRSDMSLSQAGRELGIGTSHVFRLRRRAKEESTQLREGRP